MTNLDDMDRLPPSPKGTWALRDPGTRLLGEVNKERPVTMDHSTSLEHKFPKPTSTSRGRPLAEGLPRLRSTTHTSRCHLFRVLESSSARRLIAEDNEEDRISALLPSKLPLYKAPSIPITGCATGASPMGDVGCFMAWSDDNRRAKEPKITVEIERRKDLYWSSDSGSDEDIRQEMSAPESLPHIRNYPTVAPTNGTRSRQSGNGEDGELPMPRTLDGTTAGADRTLTDTSGTGRSSIQVEVEVTKKRPLDHSESNLGQVSYMVERIFGKLLHHRSHRPRSSAHADAYIEEDEPKDQEPVDHAKYKFSRRLSPSEAAIVRGLVGTTDQNRPLQQPPEPDPGILPAASSTATYSISEPQVAYPLPHVYAVPPGQSASLPVMAPARQPPPLSQRSDLLRQPGPLGHGQEKSPLTRRPPSGGIPAQSLKWSTSNIPTVSPAIRGFFWNTQKVVPKMADVSKSSGLPQEAAQAKPLAANAKPVSDKEAVSTVQATIYKTGVPSRPTVVADVPTQASRPLVASVQQGPVKAQHFISGAYTHDVLGDRTTQAAPPPPIIAAIIAPPVHQGALPITDGKLTVFNESAVPKVSAEDKLTSPKMRVKPDKPTAPELSKVSKTLPSTEPPTKSEGFLPSPLRARTFTTLPPIPDLPPKDDARVEASTEAKVSEGTFPSTTPRVEPAGLAKGTSLPIFASARPFTASIRTIRSEGIAALVSSINLVESRIASDKAPETNAGPKVTLVVDKTAPLKAELDAKQISRNGVKPKKSAEEMEKKQGTSKTQESGKKDTKEMRVVEPKEMSAEKGKAAAIITVASAAGMTLSEKKPGASAISKPGAADTKPTEPSKQKSKVTEKGFDDDGKAKDKENQSDKEKETKEASKQKEKGSDKKSAKGDEKDKSKEYNVGKKMKGEDANGRKSGDVGDTKQSKDTKHDKDIEKRKGDKKTDMKTKNEEEKIEKDKEKKSGKGDKEDKKHIKQDKKESVIPLEQKKTKSAKSGKKTDKLGDGKPEIQKTRKSEENKKDGESLKGSVKKSVKKSEKKPDKLNKGKDRDKRQNDKDRLQTKKRSGKRKGKLKTDKDIKLKRKKRKTRKEEALIEHYLQEPRISWFCVCCFLVVILTALVLLLLLLYFITEPPSTTPKPGPTAPPGGIYFCETDFCNREADYIKSLLSTDKDKGPCDNFYDHVCDTWSKKNPLPAFSLGDGFALSRDTMIQDTLTEKLEPLLLAAPQNDVKIAADLHNACADRTHTKVDGAVTTAKEMFRSWSVPDWPVLSASGLTVSKAWKFAGKLVRDLNLATLADVDVGIDLANLSRTAIELDKPKLIFSCNDASRHAVLSLFRTALMEVMSKFSPQNVMDDHLNEVISAFIRLGSSPARPGNPDVGSIGFYEVKLIEMDSGYLELLQEVFSNIITIDFNTVVVIKSSDYLRNHLPSAVNELPVRAVVNYLGFLALVHLAPFFSEQLQNLRQLFGKSVFGRTLPDVSKYKMLCFLAVDKLLPGCSTKASAKLRGDLDAQVIISTTLTQLEEVFIKNIPNIRWMDRTSALQVSYRMKRRKVTQFGSDGDPCFYDDQKSAFGTDNPLKFYQQVSLLRQQQALQMILKAAAALNKPQSCSELSTQATFDVSHQLVHVPVALFNLSVPTNTSMFAFHLSRYGVRFYRALVHFLFPNNMYEFEAPMSIPDNLIDELDHLLSCLELDLRLLPHRLRGPVAPDSEKTRSAMMQHTLAVQLAFRAFQEQLSVRRVWNQDFRFKRLPNVSADQLFFIYYALDNCESGDVVYKEHQGEWLPAEYRVNVPLRHVVEFPGLFQCSSDSHMARLNAGFCNVFKPKGVSRRKMALLNALESRVSSGGAGFGNPYQRRSSA